MLAFALSLMLIVSSIGAVVNIGEIVKTKVYSQTAVDASAVGAGAWMARGSNLLQMINAIHWDINGFAGTICAPLLTVGSGAMTVLIACCAFPFTAASCCPMGLKTWRFVNNTKRNVMRVRRTAANIMEPVGKGINASFPLLSALHANGLAQANYADRLDAVVIGTLWIGHHRKFRFIQRYDSRLLMLNLLMLMAIAFVPFPSSVLSEYSGRTATIFYALTMALAALLGAAIWWYAARHNRLIDPQLAVKVRRRQLISPLATAAAFLISIGIAHLNADVAKLSWAVIAFVSLYLIRDA